MLCVILGINEFLTTVLSCLAMPTHHRKIMTGTNSHIIVIYDYSLVTSAVDMLNKNSLRLLKKGSAKQSRIKRIIWHLRWLASTRADISLQPSGLVRPKIDIKLRPSALVRTRTDIKLQPIGLVRLYKDWYKSKYTCRSF